MKIRYICINSITRTFHYNGKANIQFFCAYVTQTRICFELYTPVTKLSLRVLMGGGGGSVRIAPTAYKVRALYGFASCVKCTEQVFNEETRNNNDIMLRCYVWVSMVSNAIEGILCGITQYEVGGQTHSSNGILLFFFFLNLRFFWCGVVTRFSSLLFGFFERRGYADTSYIYAGKELRPHLSASKGSLTIVRGDTAKL